MIGIKYYFDQGERVRKFTVTRIYYLKSLEKLVLRKKTQNNILEITLDKPSKNIKFGNSSKISF